MDDTKESTKYGQSTGLRLKLVFKRYLTPLSGILVAQSHLDIVFEEIILFLYVT